MYYMLLLLMLPMSITAQKVFIDQPMRVGEFIVFPTVDNPNAFYYFPGNPRVAKNKEGEPQFMFTMFTEKNRTKAGAESSEQQSGGGLVHALVEYGLTAAQVKKLEAMLKAKNKAAILKGPVMFKSGNLALISGVVNSGKHVKKVIGVGKAPILEGNKAAVAFLLDKKGAQILWSSFNSSTPDISFSFEMEMPGYLSPIKGYVKGEFKDIYEAHDMSLAASGSLGPITLGAEIGATLDKLEKDGKIEVYTEGDDKERDKLIAYGYQKLVDMLFVSTDESYNQMVNNDPSKRESGLAQLEKLNENRKKFNTEPEQGEEYNGQTGSSTSSSDKSSGEASGNSTGVIDLTRESEEEGGGNNEEKKEENKLAGLFNFKKDNYIKKYAGGVSVGKPLKFNFLDTDYLLEQDKGKYESKHNDLITLKYIKRKTPVKVSLKHVAAVLDNFDDALRVSKTKKIYGRNWIDFNAKIGKTKKVSMEAWRFRGLIALCNDKKRRDKLRKAVDEIKLEKALNRAVNTSNNGNKTTKSWYLNKHNDLLKFKYPKRWANKQGNTIYSVSKKDAIAILQNYEEAKNESRRNNVIGNKTINFKPSNSNYRTVSMEAWRFRGFIDLCKTEKARRILRKKLGVASMDDLEPLKLNAGVETVLADMDDWNAETAMRYNRENKDLILVAVNSKYVKNKKLLLGNKYIHISLNHFKTILDDCRDAGVEMSVNDNRDLYHFFEYRNLFKIDTWRFNAIVKSYCSNSKTVDKVKRMLSDRIVIQTEKKVDGKFKSEYYRHLVIDKNLLLEIYNNLSTARNNGIEYNSAIQRGGKHKAVYDFGFGIMEPDQFFKAIKLCEDKRRFTRVKEMIERRGPSVEDDYYDDYFLNRLSDEEFIKSLNIIKDKKKSAPAPFSIYASYRYRKTKKEGTYKLEFKKVKAETRVLRFDENIGNIKKQCKSCFNVVNLDEMKHFRQREVLALLDGAVLSNFNNFINSASIQLKKIHPNNQEELDDATIKYTDFNKVGDINKKVTGNIRKLVYGWKNDKDDTWGNYKYKIDWTYYSNLKIPGEWKEADANVITVSSPLSLKTLTIEADPDFAVDNQIKYIIVNIEYPYGNKIQRGYVDFDEGGKFVHKVIRLKPSTGILSKKIGVILPNDVDEVSYSYTVITNDGKEHSSKLKKSRGLYIYGIDKVPEK